MDNMRRYCLLEGCYHPKPHHHVCLHCGEQDVHRSADCKKVAKSCRATGCTHPPGAPHIHKCDKCPDNTHSSKVPCPQELRGAIVKMVVGAVKNSLAEARKNVQAAAGKC